jgi:uncharacterized protein
MDDELTKPLGLKRQNGKSGKAVAVIAAFVIMVVLAASGYWGYISNTDNENQTIGSIMESVPDRQKTAQPETIAKSGPTEKPRNQVLMEDPLLPPFERQETSLTHLPDMRVAQKIEGGYLPQRSPDNLRPMDVYSRPPATEGNFGVARMVLIVGGMGISQTSTQQAIKLLPGSVTFAFAPYGNSRKRWMQQARRKGHELLLQIPMEPFNYSAGNGSPHILLADLPAEDNLARLHWLMARITNYVGLINYQGGKLIARQEAMQPLFDEIARRGLLFVNDGSLRNTATEEAASQALLPHLQVDEQIDTIRNRRKIMEKLEELAGKAQRTGLAVGYANAFPESIEMIALFADRANSRQIEITPVSAVINDPERPVSDE